MSKSIYAIISRALVLSLLAAAPATPEKFYSDDPLLQEPKPRNVEDAKRRKLSDYYDFTRNMFGGAGDRRTETGADIPALAINTLGEPMASAWWEPRHYYKRMSTEELKAGPGNANPPASGTWTVIAAKSEGITPGFTIRDEKGQIYVLKFDPVRYPELATAADMITSRIMHAVGYHVPEYYLVHFTADQLKLGDDVQLRDELGQLRKMSRQDVVDLLLSAPQDNNDGRWRGIASRMLPGKPLGPFRFDGVRADDVNDTVPHEHRRDIRGYRIACSLVNHDDSRAINTLDMLHADPDGRKYVKHYPIDFGSTLGSGTAVPNSPRNGSAYMWEQGLAAKQLFSLGIYVPAWAKKKYPKINSVGRFESKVFDPVRWVPEYTNPAFLNALPDDEFWGAKQVMALTDDDIRAIVSVAEYSDPRAPEYVAKILIERRDKIGRAFFAGVLPIDKFRIEGGKLVFDDLEVKYGFVSSRDHKVQWSTFDNASEQKSPISGAASYDVPSFAEGSYVAADISADDPEKTVTVYLRKQGGKTTLVGIDRTFPASAPRGQ